MDAIKALLKQVNTYWAGKDKSFKRNVMIVAGVLVVVIILVSVLINHVDYAILYSGLDTQDSSTIINALTTQNEPYKVSGSTISVPAKDADRLRLTLSTQITNGFNLDILKQGQGLGLTESDKQDYRKYQIQSDLQNSLRTLEGVKDAQVVLTMPSDSVLVIDTDKQAATAGVILTLENGYSLTSAQTKGIAEFVQKSVPGLTLDNISIMDSNSNVLDFSGTDDSVATSDRYALQASVEASLRKQVMALLLPIFGVGRVEAEVNAELNFDDKTTDSVTYAPVVNNKDGVIASYQKLKEQIVNGSSGGSQPGTATNTGTGSTSTSTSGTTSYPAVNVDNGTYEKNEDTVNYEVNQVKVHLQQEKGAIKTLSVSVVIDNTNLKTDLSANVKSLVMNAVGALKDNVSVEYMPMAGAHDLTSALNNEAAAKAATAKSLQTLPFIIGGAVLLAVLIGIMMLNAGKRSREKAILTQQAAIYAAQNPVARSEGVVDEETGEVYETQEQLEAIKIRRDNSAKTQIGQLIERNPELVANLLRSWLADDRE